MPPKTRPQSLDDIPSVPFNGPDLPEMPDIDGISFKDAEKAVERPVMDDGPYKLKVSARSQYKPTKAGRPAILWILEFVDNPKAAAILFNSVLPWIPPKEYLDARMDEGKPVLNADNEPLKQGQVDMSGLFVLVKFVKATKRPWQGGKIVIQELINTNIGAEFMAQVKKVPRQNDPNSYQNEIERYL